jgi:hypothetical protein
MQAVTTLEQSKTLLSVGVPKETADMLYVSNSLYNGGMIGPLRIMNKEWVDSINCDGYFLAWSLSALMELINPVQLFYEGGAWYCPWKCTMPDGSNVHMPQGGATPFDAVYKAVKNKYIMLNINIKGGKEND